MSSALHPSAVHVRERHGKDNSPLGDFASEIAPELPATGERDELRDRLYYTFPEWVLDAFDTLWAEYERAGGAR